MSARLDAVEEPASNELQIAIDCGYGYVRQLSRFFHRAQDVPVILHSEMYDADGREVRVLHATEIKRVSGVWGARRTEMRTVADSTRTVLVVDRVKFSVKMDENLFTTQGLESSRETAGPK